ncbi:MAG: TonB-dependent receptor [Candidatus Eremiobacteraeota bacterium]|nr:TonB-dependent receptor [Candidatus Eremiobacteraeota bacterium]
MEGTHAWKRLAAAVKFAVAMATAVSCITATLSPALAGTTGVVKGIVSENTGAPVASVQVALTAPSGTYHAVTDARGFYAIAGVYADTYTAIFAKTGFDGVTITGVTVFADQDQTLNATLAKSLKTIARVVSHSTASAFQPQQTVDTYTVNATQVQNFQGTDLNISESNLLASLPGVGYDSSGYPVIHGGRENEEGFEFEGIPYTDAFTNQFVNTLALPGSGIASAQLTPGVGDASVQSNGTGVINLVAARGTNPGYATSEFRVGGPGFDHAFNGAYSFASPNGTISDYAAFAGANTSARIGNGTYPANVIGVTTGTLLESDREFMNNFIFRFGKDKNQSLQFFADIAQHNFYQMYAGLNGYCFESCNPYLTSFYGGVYGFSSQQVGELTGLYPGQTSYNETLAQANHAPEIYWQPNESYKVAYTRNVNSSTLFSAEAYSVNAVSTFDFPTARTNSLGLGDMYTLQGGHRLGGQIKLQKQLNEKNFLEVGYEYEWLHPVYQQNQWGYSWLSLLVDPNSSGVPYDFISPNDPNCPIGQGNCGYAYGASPNATQLQLPSDAQNSNVNRRDQSYYISDKINVNDRLNLSLGLRDETSSYIGLPPVGMNSDCTFFYNPASAPPNPNYNPASATGTGNCPYLANFSNITDQAIKPNILEPRLGISWQMEPNTAIRATYDRATAFPTLALVNNQLNYGVFAPYASLKPYSTANTDPNTFNGCGIAPYQVQCTNYAQQLYWAYQNFYGVPFQPVRPMTSNNYQLTFQHQFTKGALRGVAFSVAPWTRRQYDTEASVAQPVLNSAGQPLIQNGAVILGPGSATNLGKEYATGVDVNITRENPVGLSGQWTMSYVNEFSSVLPTSASEDFYPSIPYSSALAGDVYRVGFVSPFQTTLGLTYRTPNGWRINPRLSYDVGYPIGNGTTTADIINGVAVNIPNTNAVPGGAAGSQGLGATYYVDPLNPGSVFDPNIVASRGSNETSSAGGKLTNPDFYANVTIEYAPKDAHYKVGFDVENVFNRLYSANGVFLNDRYQPIATGIGGPLTGYSAIATDYAVPFANPQYRSAFGGNQIFTTFPNGNPRSYYFYYEIKI